MYSFIYKHILILKKVKLLGLTVLPTKTILYQKQQYHARRTSFKIRVVG